MVEVSALTKKDVVHLTWGAPLIQLVLMILEATSPAERGRESGRRVRRERGKKELEERRERRNERMRRERRKKRR